MKFRTAVIDDLETLNDLCLKSKAHWGYSDDWMAMWVNDLTLNKEEFSQQNILVIEIGGELIGFSSIIESQENYEILHLWILPGYIGKGYGKKLLEKTIDRFVTVEKPIVVEADPNAKAFYRSQGFITFDKVESLPKGRFLPLMKKISACDNSP
jgi:ribosomal protein S18 acetylase RimI-like enzyme